MENISQEKNLKNKDNDLNNNSHKQDYLIEQKSGFSYEEDEHNFMRSLDDVGLFESAVKQEKKSKLKN